MPTPARLPSLAFALAAALLALPLALPLQADDGDLDPTFDGGAFTLAWGADQARATALEPIADGGLLVGGVVGDGPGESDGWAVVRLAADGSRVIGWDINFQVVSAGDETMAANGYLYDMRRDASDRTYLAGAAEAGIDNQVPMLARLTPQGGLDDSFDDNGLLVITDMPAAWDEIETEAAEILPDGRAVFVGSCVQCPLADETWVWVARRLPDGAPDLSFSDDGWHTIRFLAEPYSNPDSVAVDTSGRIVVGGIADPIDGDTWFARLTSSGSFDGAFGGGDGIAGPFAARKVSAIALDPATGRIASASRLAGDADTGHVYVFTAAGVPDSTFSGDGHVDLDLEAGTSIYGLVFQSDGKLLAVGTINDNGANQGGFFLARMATDGALDDTFDDNGVKRIEFDLVPNAYDWAYSVSTMGGRLVAVGLAGGDGSQEQEMAVVRTQNAQIFSDGFERGSAGAWPGF